MQTNSMATALLDKSNIPRQEDIKASMEARLSRLGIEDIAVTEVDVDIDGDITVTFQDIEGDELDAVFTVDPEDGPVVIIADDDSDEDWLIVDLDGLHPTMVKTPFGLFLNLTDLEWMNKSAFLTIFQAGDIDSQEPNNDDMNGKDHARDPWGYMGENFDDDEVFIDEARKVYVVRGGKKVKLAIVRKVKRKILTGKQKMAIKKAVRKRRAKKHVIDRKRKKSLRVRKRTKIKSPTNLSKHQKVAGTANRKR